MGHPMPTQLSDVHSQISTDSPRSAFTIRFQGSGSLLTLTVTPGRILFRARAIPSLPTYVRHGARKELE